MYKSIIKPLLFLFPLDDQTLLLKFHISLFVFVSLCLPVQELHQGDMVYNCVRVVDENELFLATV